MPISVLQSWHSVHSKIYHTDGRCPTGRAIRVRNVRVGSGEKKHCGECRKLQEKEIA